MVITEDPAPPKSAEGDRRLWNVVRLATGLLAAVALAAQFRYWLPRPTFHPLNFFSFFTIQSNILFAFVFLAIALPFRRRDETAWTSLRGATTVYLATTGLVYAALLSGLEESLAMTIPWVNLVLHTVTPIAALVDWLVDSPRRKLGVSHVALWLVYPAAYLGYSLARGARIGWYPYPFLNPGDPPDYGRVAGFGLGIFAVVALLALAVLLGGNRRVRSDA